MQKETRRTLLGAALAIAFVAGIFAIAHFSSKAPSTVSTAPPVRLVPPEEAAAKIQPNFIGTQRIGDWLLTCTKPRTAYAPAGFFRRGGARTVVLPRCVMNSLLPGVRVRKHPYHVTFQLIGLRRLLAVIVQLPGLVPSDSVAMQLSTRSIPLPVLACARPGILCLVGQILKDPSYLAALASTKQLAFLLPAGTTFRARSLNGPVYGLTETFATLRRVEQANDVTSELRSSPTPATGRSDATQPRPAHSERNGGGKS